MNNIQDMFSDGDDYASAWGEAYEGLQESLLRDLKDAERKVKRSVKQYLEL